MSDIFPGLTFQPRVLKSFSFCGAKPRHLKIWLDDQSNQDARHMSVIFYKLLPELSQLSISANQRMELLNILKPYVESCLESLAREFLKQPMSSDKTQHRVSAIFQALQKYWVECYLVVMDEWVPQASKTKDFDLTLATLISEVLAALSTQYLRSCQRYTSVPPKFWLKAHQVYVLAKRYGIHQFALTHQRPDDLNTLNTPEHYYFRLLLLDCSGTNQLRHLDLDVLYQTLGFWAPMLSLRPAAQVDDAIYWLSIGSDEGPFYRSRYRSVVGGHTLAMDLSTIVDLLEQLQAEHLPEGIAYIMPEHVRHALVPHLLSSWRQEKSREHKRYFTNTTFDICIGLRAAYDRLSMNKPFEELALEFQRNKNEVLSGHNELPSKLDAAGYNHSEGPLYSAIATDMSEHGFRLKWQGDVPKNLRNGECILLKEPDQHLWQVGTVRWIRLINQQIYVGVQLLGDEINASAASAVLPSGQVSPLFRVLSSKGEVDNQQASLITPSIPFLTQQEVEFYSQGEWYSAKLTKLILNSGNISQFTYHPMR